MIKIISDNKTKSLGKKNYLKKVLIGLTCIICMLVIWNNNYFTIINSLKIQDNIRIGVIDGHLSKTFDNIINTVQIGGSNEKTHGDEIMYFLENLLENRMIYYYDAETNGGINSDSIIRALQWMKDNEVEYVSISLSSKFFSEDIEDWLEQNGKDIKVFASYNNEKNTLDYPAMYEYVRGIGLKGQARKQSDIEFKNNKVIVLGNKGIGYYAGNSFLSPLAMILNCTDCE